MKRRLRFDSPERGQAIVLIAAVMVVVLGFTALAIDGGILYLEQRNAQNAADASVLAATYALCSGGDVQAEGLAAAAINGYDNNGTTNTVTLHNPPLSGTFAGHPDYVEVTIWADSPTHLIHLVYAGPTEVSVRAVGQCRPPMVAFSGYALVSLSTASNQTGISVTGMGDVTLVGGGAFSNSTVGNSSGSIAAGGGGTLTSDGECIDSAGSIVVDGGSTIDPICGTFLYPMQDPLATLEEPDFPGGCVDVPNINGADVVLGPGCYNGIKMNNGSLTFTGGGVYYMMDGIEINDGDFHAEESMIFFADGGFTTTGGNFFLEAPTSGEWEGMAMFSSRANTSSSEAIKFTATSSTHLIGTVYAPGVDVELAGQTGDLVIGQIIASTVHVSGDGDFEIVYDDTYFYHIPPSLEFNE